MLVCCEPLLGVSRYGCLHNYGDVPCAPPVETDWAVGAAGACTLPAAVPCPTPYVAPGNGSELGRWDCPASLCFWEKCMAGLGKVVISVPTLATAILHQPSGGVRLGCEVDVCTAPLGGVTLHQSNPLHCSARGVSWAGAAICTTWLEQQGQWTLQGR